MILNLVLVPIALVAADPTANSESAKVQPQYERWERRLRDKIAKLHQFPRGAGKDSFGDVVISFAVGPDGRPADARIRQSSRNPLFDKAALHTVRLLGPIGRVPTQAVRDRRVLLKLSYGEAPTAAAERQLAHTLEAERQANSRRNLEIVTMTADRTGTASR
jgi:TonB family protein